MLKTIVVNPLVGKLVFTNKDSTIDEFSSNGNRVKSQAKSMKFINIVRFNFLTKS